MNERTACAAAIIASCLLSTSAVCAQATTTHVALNYNFNGIVHPGEAGFPDDPNGFRSISDRALDFSSGVPNDPLLNGYLLVANPGVLDMVHLGNRNTVDNGNWMFDAVADGDDIGIQPNWLPNVDQSTPQTTTLAVPIPIDAPTAASFLYQISNGGGSFDVTFGFLSGSSATVTLSGADWFGGIYAGTGQVDTGNPSNNLSVSEATVDLSAHLGQVLAQITFGNRSNQVAGYAIYAAKVVSNPLVASVQKVDLFYNFNGIVHAGEAGLPDDPIGFRSVSDRALDFTNGVPSDALLRAYRIVDVPGALDIVHLGDRNTVDGGNWIFDAVPDGDAIGTQPLWLPNSDQTMPQTTVLPVPITLGSASWASFLYQISNGGGSFDVILGFQSGSSVTASISGSDWFGGAYAGRDQVDLANPGANLSISERRIDLAAQAGRVLTTISFANRSNLNAGYAILAANVGGCLQCGNPGGVTSLGGSNGPLLSTASTGMLGCNLDVTVASAPPMANGTLVIGLTTTAIPLSLVFPACAATLHVPLPIASVPALTDAMGRFTQVVRGTTDPVFCGRTIAFQYGQISIGPACPILLSDALAITIGD